MVDLIVPITISVNGDVGGLTQCTMVTNALKALPNGAVPDIECSGLAINTNEGFEYIYIHSNRYQVDIY